MRGSTNAGGGQASSAQRLIERGIKRFSSHVVQEVATLVREIEALRPASNAGDAEACARLGGALGLLPSREANVNAHGKLTPWAH